MFQVLLIDVFMDGIKVIVINRIRFTIYIHTNKTIDWLVEFNKNSKVRNVVKISGFLVMIRVKSSRLFVESTFFIGRGLVGVLTFSTELSDLSTTMRKTDINKVTLLQIKRIIF